MSALRASTLEDLSVIASWIRSPADSRFWAGSRVLAGHLLREALARGATRVSLNVVPDNTVAIGLYSSLGFQPAPRPSDEPASDSIYMEHAA